MDAQKLLVWKIFPNILYDQFDSENSKNKNQISQTNENSNTNQVAIYDNYVACWNALKCEEDGAKKSHHDVKYAYTVLDIFHIYLLLLNNLVYL